MSRRYKIKAKKHRVYDVRDVMELYDVCRNTVSNWVGAGLMPSHGQGPHLFRGLELNRFHAARRAQGRHNLRLDQFYCLCCKVAVSPHPLSINLWQTERESRMAGGACSECGATVLKLLDTTGYERLKNALSPNANLSKIDERKEEDSVDIGTEAPLRVPEWPSMNDRIIHDWQLYAGRYDEKTMDAHLTSIRDFEDFLEGRCFSQVRDKDVGKYRTSLLAKGEMPQEDGGLSASTIRHRASHLAAFVKWLTKQEGYRRLGVTLPDYFDLPRQKMAKALARPDKLYPSVEEAQAMVQSMPSLTLAQRRDRAIVACAFLTGLRAAALSSMRLKHIDCEAETAVQDAREMRAKNGKSFTVRWFPVPSEISLVVVEWKRELESNGFGGEDALCPDSKYLSTPKTSPAPLPILETSGAVNKAFRIASTGVGQSYSPHSARHCLKALGDQICTRSEERKAWSLNLGHESMVITEAHYGKMTEATRMQVLAAIKQKDETSDDEKDLMLRYLLHALTPGSPEYRAARQLVRQREAALDDRVLE
jgi:integrase